MNLYTDSICDKPCNVFNTDDAKGAKDNDQEKLGVGNRPFHSLDVDEDMKEFSELLTRVPAKVLQCELMTYGQRSLAKALWEACNYGGRPKPGDFKNMEPIRQYQEWVLKMEHRQQIAKTLKTR